MPASGSSNGLFNNASDEEPVIPKEVIEAYKIIAKYMFESKITSEDRKRFYELLGKVPKDSAHYNKLENVIASIKDPHKCLRALQDYITVCGMDPVKIMDLTIETSYEATGRKGNIGWD